MALMPGKDSCGFAILAPADEDMPEGFALRWIAIGGLVGIVRCNERQMCSLVCSPPRDDPMHYITAQRRDMRRRIVVGDRVAAMSLQAHLPSCVSVFHHVALLIRRANIQSVSTVSSPSTRTSTGFRRSRSP
jgi:hypothetical protein